MGNIKEQNNNDLLNNTLCKYEYLKVILERTNKDIQKDQIDKFYNEAVKFQLEFYDCRKSLNLQIYECMKKLLFDYKYSIESAKKQPKKIKNAVLSNPQLIEQKITEVHNEKSLTIEENVEIIDKNGRLNLSFLKLLLIKKIRSRSELAVDLQISIEMLDKVLSGEHHLQEQKLNRLYKRYKTNNVYDLKSIIENLEEQKDEYMPEKIKKVEKREKEETNQDLIISIENLEEYSRELTTLLKKYLVVQDISVRKFSKKLGCEAYSIYNSFNQKCIAKVLCIKLFIYFNVGTIENLIGILREETRDYEEILKIDPKKIDKYTDKISELLKKYLEMSNITIVSFGKLIGYNESTIRRIINKKANISEAMYQKLYDHFEVSTREKEDLIYILKKETENYNEIIERQSQNKMKNQEYSYQISDLIYLYLSLNNISINKFAKSINYSSSFVKDVLNKKTNISEPMYQKLYDYFEVSTKSKEGLITLLKEETENRINIIEKNKKRLRKYNNTIRELFIKYLKCKKISIKKFGNLIECSKSTVRRLIEEIQLYERAELLLNYFKVTTIEDLIIKLVEEIAEIKNGIIKTDKIDRNILFQMVDVSTLIDEEYIIFMLLFGEIRCLPSIISELLNIKEEYVLNIYNDYLNKYMEYISKSDRNNNVKILEAD